MTHSIPIFIAMLIPGAVGIGLCNAMLTALVSNAADSAEQGRVQGAAGALESLGRTVGPVWGNAVLQDVGEGAAYGAAAGVLVGAAGMAVRYEPRRRPVVRLETPPTPSRAVSPDRQAG